LRNFIYSIALSVFVYILSSAYQNHQPENKLKRDLTEAAKSRKQRRSLKQIHEELKELGFGGAYDRVAVFARVWRASQTDRANSASKRTVCGRNMKY